MSKQWIKDVIKNRSDSLHTICFILKHTLYSFATMVSRIRRIRVDIISRLIFNR